MTKDTTLILNLVSQATGLLSVVLLYVNSIGVSWQKQSWNGQTPFEQQRRRRQIITACIGVPSAIIAVLCQTAITLWPSPS